MGHQRERMLSAVVSVIAAKGFSAATIGDITGTARVSRDTFYEQFSGKEECFLAAYDAIMRELLDEVVAVGTSQADWIEGVRDGMRAALTFWSVRPEAARVCTLDIMAAGEQALVQRERSLRQFDRLFATLAERAAGEQSDLPAVRPVVARATILSALAATTEYSRQGRIAELPELEDEMVYLWLTCIAGHDVAAAAIA
jgi:AcrR family transcriptional regulator